MDEAMEKIAEAERHEEKHRRRDEVSSPVQLLSILGATC